MYNKVIKLYIHLYLLFFILFPYELLQNIEYSSLCYYTVGPCRLYFIYGSVYLLIPNS